LLIDLLMPKKSPFPKLSVLKQYTIKHCICCEFVTIKNTKKREKFFKSMIKICYELDEVAPSSFKTILISHLIRCIWKTTFSRLIREVVLGLLKIDTIVHTVLHTHSSSNNYYLTRNSIINLVSRDIVKTSKFRC